MNSRWFVSVAASAFSLFIPTYAAAQGIDDYSCFNQRFGEMEERGGRFAIEFTGHVSQASLLTITSQPQRITLSNYSCTQIAEVDLPAQSVVAWLIPVDLAGAAVIRAQDILSSAIAANRSLFERVEPGRVTLAATGAQYEIDSSINSVVELLAALDFDLDFDVLVSGPFWHQDGAEQVPLASSCRTERSAPIALPRPSGRPVHLSG